MTGRIIGSLIFAAVIGVVLFVIIAALSPQSFTILKPLLCEEWETMEIVPGDIGSGEFTIEAFCSGDGVRRILRSDLYGVMFLAYLLPIFLLIWLRFVIGALNASRRGVSFPAAQSTWMAAPSVPAVNVTVTSAHSKIAAETFALVKEALKDGVITPEEFDRIRAKASGLASGAETQSLTSRLAELQNAYAQNLITQAEYDSKRRDILDNS